MMTTTLDAAPPVPSDLRTPTVVELQRAQRVAACLVNDCLFTDAQRFVRISQDRYGGSPSIFFDLVCGYHIVPVDREHVRGSWRAERVVFFPGNDDDGESPAEFFEPLTTGNIEACVAAVMLDIHRIWMSDSIDDYLTNEYLLYL